MVTHSVYFKHRNDSKISTLIKARRLLLAKNCHAKGRELTPRIYSQLRRVDRRSQKISRVEMVTHSMYSQHRNDSKISTLIRARQLLLIYWICGSKALCSTCQQELCEKKIFRNNKFLRAGVWSRKPRKPRKFLPHKNFPLYGNCSGGMRYLVYQN